jgi:hypothetical protein
MAFSVMLYELIHTLIATGHGKRIDFKQIFPCSDSAFTISQIVNQDDSLINLEVRGSVLTLIESFPIEYWLQKLEKFER